MRIERQILAFMAVLPLCVMAQTFTVDTISDVVFQRMQGKSYKQDCTVPRSELRYLRLSHYDGNNHEHIGEIICNKLIASDLMLMMSSRCVPTILVVSITAPLLERQSCRNTLREWLSTLTPSTTHTWNAVRMADSPFSLPLPSHMPIVSDRGLTCYGREICVTVCL